MPYKLRSVNGGYSVTSPHGTKSKRTSKSKAKKQIKLLQAIEHGWKPSKRRSHHSCANGEFLDSRISKFNVQRN